MRKKNAIVLAGTALVAIVGILVRLALSFREPVYQGKKLSTWIAEYDGLPASPASQALVHIGPDAAPWLSRMLRSRDSSLSTKVMQLLAKQSLFDVKVQPAAVKWGLALKVCGALGAEVHQTSPALAGLIGDHPGAVNEATAWLAVGVLAKMGPDGIPGLIEALTNQSDVVRMTAAKLLGTAPASGTPEAVAALKICASGANTRLASAATRSLALIQHRQDQQLPPGTTNWNAGVAVTSTTPVNVWDYRQGMQLLATSSLAPGIAWQDGFGGSLSTTAEVGSLIFDDSHQDGFVDYIEWETSTPETIRSIGLIGGHGAEDTGFSRAYRSLKLFARKTASEPYALFYAEDVPVPYGTVAFGAKGFIFRNLPQAVEGVQFRAEFVRNGVGPGQAYGPRILELFGFSEPLSREIVAQSIQTEDANTRSEAVMYFGDKLVPPR